MTPTATTQSTEAKRPKALPSNLSLATSPEEAEQFLYIWADLLANEWPIEPGEYAPRWRVTKGKTLAHRCPMFHLHCDEDGRSLEVQIGTDGQWLFVTATFSPLHAFRFFENKCPRETWQFQTFEPFEMVELKTMRYAFAFWEQHTSHVRLHVAREKERNRRLERATELVRAQLAWQTGSDVEDGTTHNERSALTRALWVHSNPHQLQAATEFRLRQKDSPDPNVPLLAEQESVSIEFTSNVPMTTWNAIVERLFR